MERLASLVRLLLQEKISGGGPAARPASDRRRDELRLHDVISEKRLLNSQTSRVTLISPCDDSDSRRRNKSRSV